MLQSGSDGGRRDGWRATGVGSMPGSDPLASTAVVAGELPDWPHLAELPARGPGADMIGRAMSLVCEVSQDLAVEASAGRWRRVPAPGRDMRRAERFLADDREAAEQYLLGLDRPFSVPMAGPWTLAAAVVDAWGEASLRDHGYVAELCRAHGAAAGMLAARFQRLFPQADVVVSLDEPLLAAVHEGAIPFSSGYRRHAPIPADELVQGLRWARQAVHEAGAHLQVHTCAAPVWPVIASLRPDSFSFDLTQLATGDAEPLGTWLESGAGTVFGVWPTDRPAAPQDPDLATGLVGDWLHRLGLRVGEMPGAVAVSPRCGLAGVSQRDAVTALRGVREVARRLADGA